MSFFSLLTLSTFLYSGFLSLLPGYLRAAPASRRADDKADPVRVLAVPRDENGYGGFGSLVIDSRALFDSFKETVEGQAGWNDRASFLRVLDQAGIDFEREALVL